MIERQIIHDALHPRWEVLGKRLVNAAHAGETLNPADVEEFNSLAIILDRLGRAPLCHYNIFVKGKGGPGNYYYSEPAGSLKALLLSR